nr:polyprenyl synthetase family protein [Bacteroidota bacterium]
MNKGLQEIKAPIASELEAFEKHFRESVRSRVALLDKIMHYIVNRKGKQMRPIFVLLSARICGEITPKTYTAASLVELLHTATLVHDDVVDDAHQRRGVFSINALWKNKIAVLVGDYLLSRGLLVALDNRAYDILQIMSRAVRDMSEGELLQIEKARKLDITEDIYFDIIRKKTASLIAASCASGAASVTDDENIIENFYRFGEAIGIA